MKKMLCLAFAIILLISFTSCEKDILDDINPENSTTDTDLGVGLGFSPDNSPTLGKLKASLDEQQAVQIPEKSKADKSFQDASKRLD